MVKLYISNTDNYKFDNYPYGSLMPGVGENMAEYRFGYQGSEKDDEIQGVIGSSYTTFYRELDTRVGRWTALDPKTAKTPWESPYVSMGDNPILNTDVLGDMKDWYRDQETGNVFWRKGDAETVKTYEGHTAKNIGKAVSLPVYGAKGLFVNFYQDFQLGYSKKPLDFNSFELRGKLLSNRSVLPMKYKMGLMKGIIPQSHKDFWKNGGWTMAAAVAAPFAAQAIVSEGIISTQFWVGKAAISAGVQGVMNKGDIDWADVAIGAVTTPTAGAVLSGMVDVKINNGVSVFGYNKDFTETAIDIGTGILSNTLGANSYNLTKPLLNNRFEKGIMNATISIPSTTIGIGINKILKKEK